MSYSVKTCTTFKALEKVKALLEDQGLLFEDKVTHTIGVYDQDQLVATGSLYENVIKMIAIDQKYQGENLTSTIMTALVQKLHEQKIEKYFLFTTPKNIPIFEPFSLSLIIKNDDIVLFENSIETIVEKLTSINQKLKLNPGQTAAIVMNCNPVTYGHLYLIRKCSMENENVIIFLVEENKSIFPFDVRYELLKKSIKDLENVHILPSTQYIISRATFPTYFLKELNAASRAFMKLDISIFMKYFMPIFKIDRRYVGDEPLDPTTNAYNETMKEMLQERLVIVKRLEHDGSAVSASRVRKMASHHDYQGIKEIAPIATYKFLKSKKGLALFDDK
ncbi:MAG: GNAT family N-acetyltransferase [Acholeplasmataceae bacterium]|nr:GNAT family N-acetyltransferase [Acholeplasmataceae bacterium]